MSTVLCPIDFSESSDAAIDLAVSVALARTAPLLLFHVDPPPTLTETILSRKDYRELKQEHDAWLEGRLASARMRLRSDTGVDAASRITRGEPAKQITDAARDLKAELIVMSTHSSRARRALLGSVAETVAHTAPCPVLLVREHTNVAVPFKRPLVCVDFSTLSDHVVKEATKACIGEAEIELLHVVDEPGVAALQVSLGQRAELLALLDTLHSNARMRLEEFGATLPIGTRSPRQTVIGGPIASTILSHAAETKASLIVVGTHQPSGIRQRVLGTVADRILHHAEIPVLLCPPAVG